MLSSPGSPSARSVTRRRKRQLIKLLPPPKKPPSVAEQPVPPATSDLYPGLADTHLVPECPFVNAPAGRTPLRDWLRHFAGIDAWSNAVERFYTRAAAHPEISAYFRHTDIVQLQRHFLAALMIITGQGVTVGVVRRMRAAHAGVTNSSGEPITSTVCDAVIGVLAQVLGELVTPPATLAELATTIAPIRAAIVDENRVGS